jgi:hypothetical protein
MGNSYSRVAPPMDLGAMNVPTANYSRGSDHAPAQDRTALSESVFHSMLTLERLRAERSSKVFVLMLLDANLENGAAAGILKQAVEVALIAKRETDLVGWYKENAIFGVIFTEVNLEGERPVTETLRLKIETALIKHMGQERAAKIAISLHVFPESKGKNHSGWAADSKLYPDLNRRASRKRLPVVISGR